MLKKIKQQLLKLTKASGIFDLSIKSEWRKNKLLILAYHGVALEDEHLWDPALFIPTDFLQRRFDIIKEYGCNVLPLNEAIERLYADDLPEKAVVITFDDGNYDFFKCALPLLKEYNFPATLYLTTYYSDYSKPVFPVAAGYLLWKAKTKNLDMNCLLGLDEKFNLEDDIERARAHRLIIEHAKENNFSGEQKDDLLASMCAELHVDYAEFCRKRILQLMNAGEAAQIAESGIDVQLHTHRHRVPLDEKLFRREIEDNRHAIGQATLGDETRIKHFCYPSGEHDSRFFPWMKAENIVSATTCETALITSKTNPFLLPRLVDTCFLSEIEFEGWLSGVSQFLPKRNIYNSNR